MFGTENVYLPLRSVVETFISELKSFRKMVDSGNGLLVVVAIVPSRMIDSFDTQVLKILSSSISQALTLESFPTKQYGKISIVKFFFSKIVLELSRFHPLLNTTLHLL